MWAFLAVGIGKWVCEKTFDFVHSCGNHKRGEKGAQNSALLFTKIVLAFRVQLVLFSVFKNIANIAIEQFTKCFKILP